MTSGVKELVEFVENVVSQIVLVGAMSKDLPVEQESSTFHGFMVLFSPKAVSFMFNHSAVEKCRKNIKHGGKKSVMSYYN